MRSTPSLTSFPGSLWPRVVTPDEGKIELNRSFEVLLVFAFKLRIFCKTELLEIELL